MILKEHGDRTQKKLGIRAIDIHKWIDGLFDRESFDQFIKSGIAGNYNPYDHREYRHCKEALEEAYLEFEGKYTKKQIKAVFECHIKDDYDGYIPSREDFQNGTFKEKYHEDAEQPEKEAILSEKELSEYFRGRNYQEKKAEKVSVFSGYGLRIILPTIIGVMLFISSIFTVIIPIFRNNMLEGKKETIKELTTSAASIIDYYIEQERNGLLNREEAQAEAAREIEKMRYGIEHKDYFWITDKHPKMIMHPYRQDLINQDLTYYKDIENKSGKFLFVEFVKLIRQDNEGYLEYLWQWMNDPGRVVPKLSYVKGIDQWDWIIGTGIYIHDVEEEIDKLTEKLLLAFGSISAGVIFILVFLIWQSLKTENSRLAALTGLREAKDRYRALVEASNEGYLMTLGGQTIYSNIMFGELTGYDEKEIRGMNLLKLFEDHKINRPLLKHLEKLIHSGAEPGRFEARLKNRTGQSIDVLVKTSNIFLSNKNGSIISLVPVTGKGIILNPLHNTYSIKQPGTERIFRDLEKSTGTGHVIGVLNKMPALIRSINEQGAKPPFIRNLIGQAYNTSVSRFIEILLQEMPPPPVDFSFLSLGSNARYEMTFFSDQDNALIFREDKALDIEIIRNYFLTISQKVCNLLDNAGYKYCPGGIMACNPKWCLSLDEWKRYFRKCIINASPESILGINIFFDIHCAYGNQDMVNELKTYVMDLAHKEPQLFLIYAKNCLLYRPPLNILGHLKAEHRYGKKTINIKESIKLIELFARIYALQHRVSAPGTVTRLAMLREKGVLHESTYREAVYIYNYLWQLRLSNQIVSYEDLRRVDDELDLSLLTSVELDNLKNIFSGISSLQTKLSYDFFGTA